MSKFFEDLKEGLEGLIEYRKGNIKLRVSHVELPEKPATYKAKDIKNLRENKKYSQAIFARVLNVSPKTIQAWESGARKPNQSALRLIELVDKGIYQPQIIQK